MSIALKSASLQDSFVRHITPSLASCTAVASDGLASLLVRILSLQILSCFFLHFSNFGSMRDIIDMSTNSPNCSRRHSRSCSLHRRAPTSSIFSIIATTHVRVHIHSLRARKARLQRRSALWQQLNMVQSCRHTCRGEHMKTFRRSDRLISFFVEHGLTL